MNFNEKIECMMGNFSKFNIPQKIYAPPLYRWLWSKQIGLIPPIFQSIVVRTMLFAIPFFVFGLVVFLWPLNKLGLNLVAPFVWLGLGLFLGYSKAKGMKRNAEAIGVPSWENYDPTKFVPAPDWERALIQKERKRGG